MEKLQFEEWFSELKNLATIKYSYSKNAVASFDEISYKEYYNDGYDPESALIEDIKNAL